MESVSAVAGGQIASPNTPNPLSGGSPTARLDSPVVSPLWGQLTPALQQLNAQLNQAKDTLGRPDFEKLKRNDPFERDIRKLRRTLEDQKSAQKVTRAWLKMYAVSYTHLRAHETRHDL